MKNFKKIASLMLALVIVMAMSVTAFAATGDFTTTKGTITIQNTIMNTDYSIYRIFDLESFSEDEDNTKDAYSYKVNSAWAGFFTAPAEGVDPTNGRKYVDIDANGYVTWKTGANQAAFANEALTYATADATKITADATQKASANNTDVVFNELDLGYYLVDSSAGAVCALDTTNPNATIIEKNTNPTLDKKVQEGTDWGKKNDANVGDTVNFQATITVYGTAKNYIMRDLMDNGLTFGTVTQVTKNGTEIEASNYTVNTTNTTTETFNVTFTDTFCKGLVSGDVIVVSYTATLDADADVNQPENNKAHLQYKAYNDTVQNTEDSTTQTYTWEIPVLKYANSDKNKPLAGAEFALYKTETDAANDSNRVKFKWANEKNYQHNTTGSDTSFTTEASGRFRLQGLDAGTYYLKEVTAPTGYNRLNTVVEVTIDHDGHINAVDKNSNGTIEENEYEAEIGVNNQAGTELPSTGGIGTVIFYIVGGILLVGAGVILVVRKRMNTEAKNK